jgi:hypothetical protein
MALDRDAERVLEMVQLAERAPYETLTAPEARALFRAGREALTPDPLPVAEIRELSAPREDGGATPIRLYRGATTVSGEVPPALVYFHGGGWVIGDLDTHDNLCVISPMRPNASSSLRITASLRSTNFRPRSRTASPRPLGRPNRRQHWASTPIASPSAATVRAATWRRWLPCWRGLGGRQGYPSRPCYTGLSIAA